VHQVTVRVDGTPVSGTLPVQFISGADPSAINSASSPNTVAVQASTSTNPVTVPPYSVVRADLNSPPVVAPVNNASYTAGVVAPQEIVSLFGSGIASGTASATLPLPTSLEGTSVRITDSAGNTQLAPVFAVSPGQANILIPSGLAAGAAKVTVLAGSTASLAGSMTIASAAPGLYSMNQDGANVAAAVALLYSASNQVTNETVFNCNAQAVRSCLPVPLSLGGATDTLYVELYGTGIRGAASVQCFVAGQSVPVLYAGAAAGFSGLDQVNVSIPRSLAGAGMVRVYLVADGTASNAVSLAFQ